MPTKRQLQATQTKQRILETAERLIGENGYANVTVRDIAQECGIALGTMYHYFNKKEDLIRYIDHNRFRELNDLAAEDPAGNPLDQLKAYIGHWFEAVGGDNINYSRQWYQMSLSQRETLGEDNEDRLEQDIKYIERYLDAAVESGLLRQDTPSHEIANDIVFSMYGAGLERCLTRRDFNFTAWGKTFVDSILPRHINLYRTI